MSFGDWLKADHYAVPRDFFISAAVGGVALGAALTLGAPFLAAAVVGGVVGSLAVYGIEHAIHHEKMTAQGLVIAGGIGALGGLVGGVVGPAVGSALTPVASRVAGTEAATLVTMRVTGAGVQAGEGLGGVLAGGPLAERPHVTQVGDASKERGIAFSPLGFYETVSSVFGVLPQPEEDHGPRKLTAADLWKLPTEVSHTRVPEEAPPGTGNVVIGVIRPNAYAKYLGEDDDLVGVPALAAAYHAKLIVGDPEKDFALTREEIERQLAGFTGEKKINALAIVGHSGTVPSDMEERISSIAPATILPHLPVWTGVGVIIGSADHRETLVPGLQTILEQAAAEHHVPVSDLFSKDAVIEFQDCEVGKNREWLQHLADLTGARVVAYENNVHTFANTAAWQYRGIDDGAVHPRADDGRVEFNPRPVKSKGFLDGVGHD